MKNKKLLRLFLWVRKIEFVLIRTNRDTIEMNLISICAPFAVIFVIAFFEWIIYLKNRFNKPLFEKKALLAENKALFAEKQALLAENQALHKIIIDLKICESHAS